MDMNYMDTLSETMNKLSGKGYTGEFSIMDDVIVSAASKVKYKPEDLVIKESYRFEAPSKRYDSSELFAIEAGDGTKGTLVISFGAKHSQNAEVVKKIKKL